MTNKYIYDPVYPGYGKVLSETKRFITVEYDKQHEYDELFQRKVCYQKDIYAETLARWTFMSHEEYIFAILKEK